LRPKVALDTTTKEAAPSAALFGGRESMRPAAQYFDLLGSTTKSTAPLWHLTLRTTPILSENHAGRPCTFSRNGKAIPA
jgi:hypothetical protein